MSRNLDQEASDEGQDLGESMVLIVQSQNYGTELICD